jgi:hypothetical protein
MRGGLAFCVRPEACVIAINNLGFGRGRAEPENSAQAEEATRSGVFHVLHSQKGTVSAASSRFDRCYPRVHAWSCVLLVRVGVGWKKIAPGKKPNPPASVGVSATRAVRDGARLPSLAARTLLQLYLGRVGRIGWVRGAHRSSIA